MSRTSSFALAAEAASIGGPDPATVGSRLGVEALRDTIALHLHDLLRAKVL